MTEDKKTRTEQMRKLLKEKILSYGKNTYKLTLLVQLFITYLDSVFNTDIVL